MPEEVLILSRIWLLASIRHVGLFEGFHMQTSAQAATVCRLYELSWQIAVFIGSDY